MRRRVVSWLCILLLCLPAAANAALPTLDQLRGLFARTGLEMDEEKRVLGSETLYTMVARGAPVQIQAIEEDGLVNVVLGSFGRSFSRSAQQAHDMLVRFLYACYPDFTGDGLYAWVYGTGYASWGAQLIGASLGGPWYGPVKMGDNWVSVAYGSNRGTDMLGIRFEDEPSRFTCNVHPEVWAAKLLEVMEEPIHVPVDSLHRYPDRYEGQVVTLTGILAQKVDDAHYVVKTYDGRRVFCPMLFGMNSAPVLEGDSVKVTGISAGLIVSRTVLGAATELPCVLAFVIK